MGYNERPQKIDKTFPFIYYTQKILADQKRVERKKAAGSENSDDDRPIKKGKANEKSKKR